MNNTETAFRSATAEPGEPPTPIRHIRAGKAVEEDGLVVGRRPAERSMLLASMDADDPGPVTLEGDEPMSPRAREAWALMLGIGIGGVLGYLVGVAL